MLLSKAIEGFILYAEGGAYSPAYIPTLQGRLNYICKYFGDPEIESITAERWSQFWHHLHTEYKPKRFGGDESPLKYSSIDNYWKIIRGFCRWANEALSIARVELHLKRPKYELPEIFPYSQDEVKRLLDACQYTQVVKESGRAYKIKRQNADRDKSIIMILLDTGMRPGEFTRVTLGDVNLESGEIYIRPYRSSKKSKGRTVFLGSRTKQIVWRYIAKQQAELRQSDPLINLKVSSLRLQIHRIGENAKVEHAYPYRFRHTFAVNFLLNRGDVFTLQRLMGHKTLEMTMRYVNFVKSDLQEIHRYASPVDNWRL